MNAVANVDVIVIVRYCRMFIIVNVKQEHYPMKTIYNSEPANWPSSTIHAWAELGPGDGERFSHCNWYADGTIEYSPAPVSPGKPGNPIPPGHATPPSIPEIPLVPNQPPTPGGPSSPSAPTIPTSPNLPSSPGDPPMPQIPSPRANAFPADVLKYELGDLLRS